MTINNITAKLRKKNKGNYRILEICIFISVLLVSSYSYMYFSPTVQSLLPEGGDTRKVSWLMFGMTMFGCVLFTVYGINLFFRYKSREVGIFLALGEQKSKIALNITKELSSIIIKDSFLGLMAAAPVSFIIWKIFQHILIGAENMNFHIGILGIAVGIIFTLILTACIFISEICFIKQTDIIQILNAHRKTEMVKEVKPYYGKLGVVLMVLGFFLAVGVPGIMPRLFSVRMPSIWNVTYVICIAGIYMCALKIVAGPERKSNPKGFYNNIISTNLMRFSAKQTTKNMCVIAVLVFVLIISSFWGMQYYSCVSASADSVPMDYYIHYPKAEKQITKKEIFKLAEKNNVHINFYEETEALQLLVNYKGKDLSDDGKYFDIERKKYASFISVSEYKKISGTSLELNKGEYMTITVSDYKRSIWVGPDCLQEIIHPVTDKKFKPVYKGSVEFDNLAVSSDPFTFILCDEDYSSLSDKLNDNYKEHMVLFNVKDLMNSYEFASELKNEYINYSTDISNHLTGYDAYEEETADKLGQEYGYAGKLELSPHSTNLIQDWKYAPVFRILIKADLMPMVAVFVLLSMYIAIISLTAIGIMTYVRSITIAIDNKKLFDDITKLGADENYKNHVIAVQLRKIFYYPGIIGSSISLLFSLFLVYFNDMYLSKFEIFIIIVECIIIVLVFAFLSLVYSISFKKMKKFCD